MESASLDLLSNKPEYILNVNHVLKSANHTKKKGAEEEEPSPVRSRSHFLTF